MTKCDSSKIRINPCFKIKNPGTSARVFRFVTGPCQVVSVGLTAQEGRDLELVIVKVLVMVLRVGGRSRGT